MSDEVTCEVVCRSEVPTEVTTMGDHLEAEVTSGAVEVTSPAVEVTSPAVSNVEVPTWVAVEATETQWVSRTKNEATCSLGGMTRQTQNEVGARSRLSSVQQTQCDDLTFGNSKKAAVLNTSNKDRR